MNTLEVLKEVSFPVKMFPAGYREIEEGGEWRSIPTRRVLVRTDTMTPLAVHSDQYKLIPYQDMVLPLLEHLDKNGGSLVSRIGRGKRLRAVSLESEGRRLWIEANFKNMGIDIGADKILPRVVYGNSYDGTASYRAIVGFFQVNCTNIGALMKPGRVLGMGGTQVYSKRHIGAELEQNQLGDHLSGFLQNFEQLGGTLRAMANSVVEEAEAKKIYEENVGIRFSEKNPVKLSWPAWELYSKITNYLTFDFKGGVAVSERRAQVALAQIQAAMRG